MVGLFHGTELDEIYLKLNNCLTGVEPNWVLAIFNTFFSRVLCSNNRFPGFFFAYIASFLFLFLV